MSKRDKDERTVEQAVGPGLPDMDELSQLAEMNGASGSGEDGGSVATEVSAEPTEAEEIAAATYDVYLEEAADGLTLALILDLPGCFASGVSRDEALEQLQQTVTEYHAWLRRHDDYTPEVRGPFVFNIQETFQIAYEDGEEINSFFSPDAEPATDEDIEWALALMGWQREDLLEYVGGLSAEALDWNPVDDADVMSVRQILDHVAQAEVWYMGRLDETPPHIIVADLPGSTLDRLQRVRQAAVMRVKTFPKEWRGKVFMHQGEQWSLRKALRRAVWHERDHLSQIDDMLEAYRASAGS